MLINCDCPDLINLLLAGEKGWDFIITKLFTSLAWVINKDFSDNRTGGEKKGTFLIALLNNYGASLG